MSIKKKKWLIKKVIFARFKNLFIKNNNNKNLIPKKKYTTNLKVINFLLFISFLIIYYYMFICLSDLEYGK